MFDTFRHSSRNNEKGYQQLSLFIVRLTHVCTELDTGSIDQNRATVGINWATTPVFVHFTEIRIKEKIAFFSNLR